MIRLHDRIIIGTQIISGRGLVLLLIQTVCCLLLPSNELTCPSLAVRLHLEKCQAITQQLVVLYLTWRGLKSNNDVIQPHHSVNTDIDEVAYSYNATDDKAMLLRYHQLLYSLFLQCSIVGMYRIDWLEVKI